MSEAKGKNTIIKDAMVLCIITLIAGLALGLVYELTKEPIAQAKLQEKRQAYKVVFQEAASFEDKENKYATVGETSGQLLESNAGISNTTITEVLEATASDGTILGYVMTVSSLGYGGQVPITIGVTLDGKIEAIEVLKNSETAGFGANASLPEFKDQFAGIQAEQIEYTKGEKTKDNEIAAVSGATITTKAVTNAVNAALYYVQHELNN